MQKTMRTQIFDKRWDLSICYWLVNMCRPSLGENVCTGSDHAYEQQAVE